MRRRSSRSPAKAGCARGTLAALCFLLGPAAAPAAAGPPLVRGISDSLALTAAVNAKAPAPLLRRFAGAAAGIVRIGAGWEATTDDPLGTPLIPASPRDPADPSYNFDLLDATVQAVTAAGETPLIVVSHAPPFAEAAPRWRFAAPGSWGVRPSALADFGAALATRYSGNYVPAGATAALPRVTLYQAWNEPNLADYLAPQWVARDKRWSTWSPRHYRLMQNAFYDAVKSADPGATVVSAGIAPNGDPTDGEGRMTPMRFVRAFLCLDAAGRPVVPHCADPPRLDAFAFHPLSIGDPDRPAALADDVGIADIGKLTEALRVATHAGLLARVPPLWITELNWTTGPHGAPPALQAHWVSRGLHRLWLAGASVVLWEFFRDRADQRPAGLLTRDGRRKQLWTGWTFPLDVLRTGAGEARAWVLAPPGATRVCLELRRSSAWHRARCVAARAGAPREVLLHLGGAAEVRAVAGRAVSAVAEVSG